MGADKMWRKGKPKTKVVACTEFCCGGDGSVMRRSEPKPMTKREVMAAVAEWYDAVGTNLNDFDGIQFVVYRGTTRGEATGTKGETDGC